MVEMARSVTTATGVALVVYALVFLLVSFDDAATATLGGTALLGLAGIVFIFAGVRETVSVGGETLVWQQINGVGILVLALGWVVVALPVAVEQPFVGILAAVGGVVAAGIGVRELHIYRV